MTVRETIQALSAFDGHLTVYVPDITDGTVQIATNVCQLMHVDLPIEGVTIPPDVVIVPYNLDQR